MSLVVVGCCAYVVDGIVVVVGCGVVV